MHIVELSLLAPSICHAKVQFESNAVHLQLDVAPHLQLPLLSCRVCSTRTSYIHFSLVFYFFCSLEGNQLGRGYALPYRNADLHEEDFDDETGENQGTNKNGRFAVPKVDRKVPKKATTSKMSLTYPAKWFSFPRIQ